LKTINFKLILNILNQLDNIKQKFEDLNNNFLNEKVSSFSQLEISFDKDSFLNSIEIDLDYEKQISIISKLKNSLYEQENFLEEIKNNELEGFKSLSFFNSYISSGSFESKEFFTFSLSFFIFLKNIVSRSNLLSFDLQSLILENQEFFNLSYFFYLYFLKNEPDKLNFPNFFFSILDFFHYFFVEKSFNLENVNFDLNILKFFYFKSEKNDENFQNIMYIFENLKRIQFKFLELQKNTNLSFKLSYSNEKIFKLFIFNVLYNNFDDLTLKENHFIFFNHFLKIFENFLDSFLKNNLSYEFFWFNAEDGLLSFLNKWQIKHSLFKGALLINIIDLFVCFLFDYFNKSSCVVLSNEFADLSFSKDIFNFFFNQFIQFFFFFVFEYCNFGGLRFEPDILVDAFISNLEEYFRDIQSFVVKFKGLDLVNYNDYFSNNHFFKFYNYYRNLLKEEKIDNIFFKNWEDFFYFYFKFLPDSGNYFNLYKFFGKIYYKMSSLDFSRDFLKYFSEQLQIIKNFSEYLEIIQLEDGIFSFFDKPETFKYRNFADFKKLIDFVRVDNSVFNLPLEIYSKTFDDVYANLLFLIFGESKDPVQKKKRDVFFLEESFSEYSFVQYLKLFFLFLYYELSTYENINSLEEFQEKNRFEYFVSFGYLLDIIFNYSFNGFIEFSEVEIKQKLIANAVFIFKTILSNPILKVDNFFIEQSLDVLQIIVFILLNDDLKALLDLNSLKY
jgi:hypothetical protein